MLSDDLRGQLTVDLDVVFTDLAGSMTGADFGDVRFDAAGILALVASAAPPDLAGVGTVVEAVRGRLTAQVDVGLPGGELPAQLGELTGRLGLVGSAVPSVEVTADVGLEGLAARLGVVQDALEAGPVGSLLALVPGANLPDTLGRAGGGLGGLIELLRVLSGLTATAAISARMEERARRLAGLLDADAAKAAGDTLGRLAAETGLVAALRGVDPGDPQAVDQLGRRVVAFLDAVLEVGDRWSSGMAFGEAALIGLDAAATGAGLEVARLTLESADLEAVAGLVAEVRQALDPLLALPLPDPAGAVGALFDQALALVGQLTTGVRAWDAGALSAEVQGVADLVLAPVEALGQELEAVGTGVTAAIGSLRQLVDEVDLTPVANAVGAAMQPVVDTLDAIEDAVATADAVLQEVAGNLVSGLGEVSDAVQDATVTVTDQLGRVRSALLATGLEGLGERLEGGLATAVAALASAQLAPYFDAAIDVIDTAADVIDAVPFSLLPTDVQQEVVDVCQPIRELELQPVEDALRAELDEIRESLRADALAAVEEAYAAVVGFLVELDPGPRLEELEAGALAELRAIVEGIDPEALLAPASDALGQLRALLDGLDLERDVLAPLDDAFQPVLDALDTVDPAALLAGARAEVDQARETLAGLLHLDQITGAVEGFREQAAQALARVDPAALAGVLDGVVAEGLRRLPAGPPGGPFGSLLVSVAQASGLDATEGAVGDLLDWVAGRADGAAVVRGRLAAAAEQLGGLRDTVGSLDPAPLAAAAASHHRALTAAVAEHPAGSALRVALDPLLDGVRPTEVLGGLAPNRLRYLAALGADTTLVTTLAASVRSEVGQAAAGLRGAISPLDAIPARLRALLGALGVEAAGQPLRDVLTNLLEEAGPERLVPALTELTGALRDQTLAAIDAATAPVLGAVATVEGALAVIDLGPVVDELSALHAQVRAEIEQLSPRALLGDAVAAADEVVARLQAFDPLAPVRTVLDEAQATALEVLDTARPTVVFAPVDELHADVVRIAGGLDVAALLAPMLEVLDGLVVQLDEGFDRTGDALQRLQDALPSAVTESAAGIEVEAGVGFG